MGDGVPLSRALLILRTYAYVRMFVNLFPFLDSMGSLISYRLIFSFQILIETIAILILIKTAITIMLMII